MVYVLVFHLCVCAVCAASIVLVSNFVKQAVKLRYCAPSDDDTSLKKRSSSFGAALSKFKLSFLTLPYVIFQNKIPTQKLCEGSCEGFQISEQIGLPLRECKF